MAAIESGHYEINVVGKAKNTKKEIIFLSKNFNCDI